MKSVPIADLVETVSTWNPSTRPDDEFEYIDLSSIDSDSKTVRASSRIKGLEAPSRARQLAKVGDVLVSTVRPNLNSVSLIPERLDGATVSTGFTVLRPKAYLDGKYLFHWVRTPLFISEMARLATGANYPAVSDRIVKGSLIPLPTLTEQRRIAAILDHADGLRVKRRQVVDRLDGLSEAVFKTMFGDADASEENLPFGEVAELAGGRNLVADDAGLDSPYRVLKISAVTSGRFRPDESKPLPLDYVPPVEHLVREGDLLMSRANTADLVGAVAQVGKTPANLALPDKIWRFVWKDSQSEPSYFCGLFRTPAIRRRISQLSSGTGGSMKNVAKAKLEQMPIPRVNHARQAEFAIRAQRIEDSRQICLLEIAWSDELFASLQARAFAGEL